MRKLLTPFLISSLAALAMAGEDKQPLADETDRINYVIGHQIGADFRKQQIDLDRLSLKHGLEDGHAAGKPALELEEMNRLLVDLKKDITEDMEQAAIARMQKRQAEIKHKRQLGREFLQTNASKPGIIATESGLQYRVIRQGEGVSPRLEERVRLAYTARRLNGQVFDSSEKQGGPRVHQVGDLPRGFSEALQLMKPGARWELFLPPELAFGRQGPLGHETLIAEVELLEVIPAAGGTASTTAGKSDND